MCCITLRCAVILLMTNSLNRDTKRGAQVPYVKGIPEISERLKSCTLYYGSFYINAHKTSLVGWFLTSDQPASYHVDSFQYLLLEPHRVKYI